MIIYYYSGNIQKVFTGTVIPKYDNIVSIRRNLKMKKIRLINVNTGKEVSIDKYGNLVPIVKKSVIDYIYKIMTYSVRVNVIYIFIALSLYIAVISYETAEFIKMKQKDEIVVPTISYFSDGPQHQIVDEVERCSSTTVSDNFILSDNVISLIENNDLDLNGIRLSGDIGSSMYITYDPDLVYNEKYAQDVLSKLYISKIDIDFVGNMPTYTYTIDWR